MKKHFFISVLLLALAFGVNNVNAKNTVKATDSYTISHIDMALNTANFVNNWVIEYGDNGKNIEVFKSITRNGEEYIVRHDFFEVRYVNSSNGFGVRSLRNNQQVLSPAIVTAVINETQMKQQQLLWNNKLSEEKALDYIASFVPHLLNENYKHLLN